MVLTLDKGESLSLDKASPGLVRVRVGLGWSARTTAGVDFDLDASALLCAKNANDEFKVRSNADFVFYKQPADADGSVVHQGDERTGAKDGDDEQITIDLSKVPADVAKIVISASIYEEGDVKTLNFGQVRNAYIRVLNEDLPESDPNAEILKYDLSEDYDRETALNFGELYRHNGGWKFRAVGQGYPDGLFGIATDYGVKLG